MSSLVTASNFEDKPLKRKKDASTRKRESNYGGDRNNSCGQLKSFDCIASHKDDVMKMAADRHLCVSSQISTSVCSCLLRNSDMFPACQTLDPLWTCFSARLPDTDSQKREEITVKKRKSVGCK